MHVTTAPTPALAAPLWEVLAELVACDTATGTSTLPAADLLAARLDRPGWAVAVDRPAGPWGPTVVARAGPAAPGGLILSGHMDTVPWDGQPGWSRDPLRLVHDGVRMFGRGVSDMKGFLAACAALADTVDPAALRRPLVLLFTSDEEVGCRGAEQLVPRLAGLLGDVPVPPHAVIGEPTGGAVYRAHRGHIRMTVSTHGRGGHSSRPDLGANAIAAMAEAVRAVGDVALRQADRTSTEARRLFPEHPAVPFNPGLIRGGTADNMIAERCSLTLDVRPGPDDAPAALAAELETAMRAAAQRAVSGATLVVDETVVTPGMVSPATGPLPELLREITGCGDMAGAPYTTDGGRLAEAGIASYVWGPGELAQAHQADESLPIAALAAAHRGLARLVARACT